MRWLPAKNPEAALFSHGLTDEVLGESSPQQISSRWDDRRRCGAKNEGKSALRPTDATRANCSESLQFVKFQRDNLEQPGALACRTGEALNHYVSVP